MIAFLRGNILSKSPTEIVLDVNGVGYGVQISLSTFSALKDTEPETKLFTYLHVREDAMVLYGFATESEREIFKLLISVSGIGPKMAQGILSGMNAEEFCNAVITENISSLTAISGVGKKTAERLVIELRDKFGKMEMSSPPAVPKQTTNVRGEVVLALTSLGFARNDAEQVLRTIFKETDAEQLSIEEIIRRALRFAGK
jgi:Holliday junction DNA helicase RuvA